METLQRLRDEWECGKSPRMPKPFSAKKFYARLDSKNRLTLRGAKYNQFEVQPRPDGSFLARPVVMVKPEVVQPKASASAAARKARALKIAATAGPKTVAIVKRMKFRKANGRERAIAATLTERASAALKRHGRASA